ncbi:MAG: DUF808 domain-containing protein [Hyphomicrobium aestuarii]|nr:DUF808 domain-containing protein [Hyphomicrobium aestuarii]
MSSGLLALLDDIAAIAKIAAASLDDAAGAAAKASAKAAGIVIDDTAVTPRYVVGFAADRELPIVGRIAWGSIKNKMLFLLPGAVLLDQLAPWAIIPLLMAGGAFLCFEGYEKVHEWIYPHHGVADGDAAVAVHPISSKQLEDERVAGAIRTDLILSAEIMAIALATVAGAPFITKLIALVAVALLVTGGVYGLVAIIVKADDVGTVMARSSNGAMRMTGRGIVTGMPGVLSALSTVGTLAMLWVGGGIVIHGLHEWGITAPEAAIHGIAHTVGGAVPLVGSVAEWLISASIAAALGLVIGFVVERGYVAVKSVIAPSKPATHF